MQDDQQVIDVEPQQGEQQQPQQQTTAVARYQEAMPALSVDAVKNQVQNIQRILRDVMKVDEHYGKVPGCGDKPTLLQPGAQKIALTFGFAPKYSIEERQQPHGHREYDVRCSLYHRESGRFVGEGVGVGSTMESKYRWRKAERTCPQCGTAAIIKGKAEYGGGWLCFAKRGGCGAKFSDGDHSIEGQSVGRTENPDIADQYNTVLKMAKKRAYVDAVLTATAASDLFTQDLEDMPGAATTPPADPQPAAPQPQQGQPPQQPQQNAAPPPQQQPNQAPPPQQNQQPPQQQPNPAQQAGRWKIRGVVQSVEEKKGQNANGPWTRYAVTMGDGKTYSTFSESDGAAAQQVAGTGAEVEVELEQKGKYTNLVGIDVSGDGQQQAQPQQQQQSPPPTTTTTTPPRSVTCTIQQIAANRQVNIDGQVQRVYSIDTDFRDPNVPNDTGRFGVVGDELCQQVDQAIGHQVMLTYVTDTRGRRVTLIESSDDIPF